MEEQILFPNSSLENPKQLLLVAPQTIPRMFAPSQLLPPLFGLKTIYELFSFLVKAHAGLTQSLCCA